MFSIRRIETDSGVSQGYQFLRLNLLYEAWSKKQWSLVVVAPSIAFRMATV